MSSPYLHLSSFEGGAALSDFRAAALLARLQEVEPSISALSARHVHWVATDHAPDDLLRQRLAALLDQGVPVAPAAAPTSAAAAPMLSGSFSWVAQVARPACRRAGPPRGPSP